MQRLQGGEPATEQSSLHPKSKTNQAQMNEVMIRNPRPPESTARIFTEVRKDLFSMENHQFRGIIARGDDLGFPGADSERLEHVQICGRPWIAAIGSIRIPGESEGGHVVVSDTVALDCWFNGN